ncbi:hypothetical protein BGZ46_000009 [Entomortierella lignicola]|nr:hypothetical protein BGZ46_000009 [Entomortierella lignicola]
MNTDYAEKLGNLTEELEKSRIQCGIPGMSMAIFYKGNIIYAKGFGKRNEQDPFTEETLAPIGSLTKAFTATAIGELVAEGKVDWDTTPVNQYLPDFQLKDPILTSQLTFADLLSHRTGFPNIDITWHRTTVGRRDLIKRLKYVDVGHKLRSSTKYINVMYGVAGEAAANVAGVSYEKVVKSRVLEPLGLNNTGLSHKEMRTRPNYALPYDADSLEQAQNGNFVTDNTEEAYMVNAPAGGMYSNVLDLVKWGRVIMQGGASDGEQILNKDSVKETLSAQSISTKTRRSKDFAPVCCYGQTNIGHILDGSFTGYRSHLAMFPDHDLVVAQVANAHHIELLGQAIYTVADRLLSLPVTQDWIFDVALKATQGLYAFKANMATGRFPERVEGTPIRDLKDYVGSYSDKVFGDITVRLEKVEGQENEVLFFKMGTFDCKLEHYHYDSFRTELHDFVIKGATLVSFQVGGTGAVEEVQLIVSEILTFKKQDSRPVKSIYQL